MSLNQISRNFCSLSIVMGLFLSLVFISPVCAQIKPPPGPGTPSGTAGGGSRS
ncbi:hypothetical protein NC980_01305 [Leptolyngbya sp. AS-A5]